MKGPSRGWLRPLVVLMIAVLGGAACGARTELHGTGADAAIPGVSPVSPACSVTPLKCSDNTRGTWRLELPNHTLIGYLFTFDGRPTCNGTAASYEVTFLRDGSTCDRNSNYVPSENSPIALRFNADNLGGSFGPPCGHPDSEGIDLRLDPKACDGITYDLAIHDVIPGASYDTTAIATRCRCDIGWVPCVEPLPDDPCAP